MKTNQGIRNGGRYGFTLAELFVVIAIIAVLVDLLLPTLSRAKQKGLQAACLNHMRQLDLAWHMYANDLDQQNLEWLKQGFPLN